MCIQAFTFFTFSCLASSSASSLNCMRNVNRPIFAHARPESPCKLVEHVPKTLDHVLRNGMSESWWRLAMCYAPPFNARGLSRRYGVGTMRYFDRRIESWQVSIRACSTLAPLGRNTAQFCGNRRLSPVPGDLAENLDRSPANRPPRQG